MSMSYREYTRKHEARARARILRVARMLFWEARLDQYKAFRELVWEAYEALCSVIDENPNDLATKLLEEYDGRHDG